MTRFKKLRKAKRFTQAGLAKRLGCTLSTVRHLEADPPRRSPSLELAVKIERVLGIKPAYWTRVEIKREDAA